MQDAFFIYVTAGNENEATSIARTVVEERLAACANLLGPIQSIYWWNGLCSGNEVALVLKTSGACKDELVERVKQLHAYDCPCIVCLPIVGGNPAFLDWLAAETRHKA